MRILLKCVVCNKDFKVLPYREKTAKFCSLSCKSKIQGFRKNHSVPKSWRNRLSQLLSGRKLSLETRRRISLGHQGNKSYLWKGGKIKHSSGYVLVYAPKHPLATQRHIYEHRLVMEKKIGRYLHKWEICHHINKIKDDNRIENLMLFSNSGTHRAFEKGYRINKNHIVFDGSNLK